MKLAFPKPKKQSKRKTRWRKGLDGQTHEFLYGREAHLQRRMEVYERAGGVCVLLDDGTVDDQFEATCRLCPVPHPITWSDAHWIHLQKRHCDCNRPECTTFGCIAAHRKLHPDGRLGA